MGNLTVGYNVNLHLERTSSDERTFTNTPRDENATSFLVLGLGLNYNLQIKNQTRVEHGYLFIVS